MDRDAKKLMMFDALLSGDGLQRLVDTAAEVLGNPVVVCDMGLAPVARSSSLADDERWLPIPVDPNSPEIRQASLAGDFRKVYAGDRTVVGEYPAAPHRYLAARVRRGSNLLGHALVLELSRPFEQEDMDLLPEVCRTFGYALAADRDADRLTERYGRIIDDLLEGRLDDDAEAEARAKRARLSLPDALALLVIRPVSDKGVISTRHLREQLLGAFRGSIGVVRGDAVVMVADAAHAGDDLGKRLSAAVYLDSLAVGVSRPFSRLSQTGVAYGQALAALRLSSAGENAPGVTRYDEVAVRHLFECATRTEDARLFAHPAVELLEQADLRDGTSHLDDLRAYLFNGRNATATARALYVHKNTMYYRLQRIQQIADVDLDDEMTCFALQVAMAMR